MLELSFLEVTVKKKFSFLYLMLIFGILVLLGSCRTFHASGLQMGMDTGGTEIMGTFTTRIWVGKFLGTSGGTNLFNFSSAATTGPIRDAIDREIQRLGGNAAIDVSVTWGSNPIQWILNNLTLRLWAPGTATIRGTVIRQ